MVRYLENFSTLMPYYDVFIFDIYGVLHNGEQILHPIIDCLQHLKDHKKHIILVSNAPQPALKIQENIEKFGIKSTHYHYVLTAGEMAHTILMDKTYSQVFSEKKRCYIIGHGLFPQILEGTHFQKTDMLHKADFILNLGPDESHHKLKNYYSILNGGLKHKLPMICANPDLEVFKGNQQELRAGGLAQYYQSKGGFVEYYGKPYPAIYDMALKNYARAPSNSRVLAIGDSFGTDYRGAKNIGVDILICFGSLTARELALDFTTLNQKNAAEWMGKILEAGYNPEYIAFERLIW